MPIRRFDTLKLAWKDLQETEAEFNAVNQQVQKLTNRRSILHKTLRTRKSIIFDIVSHSYTYELRTGEEAVAFVAIHKMLPSEQRPMLHHIIVQGLDDTLLESIVTVLTKGGVCIGFDKSIGRTPTDVSERKMGTRLIEQNLPAKGKSSLVTRGGIEARGKSSLVTKGGIEARGSESSLTGIKRNLLARGSESSLATKGGGERAVGSESGLATRGGSERRNLETRARQKSMDSPPYKLNKVDP